ncbi:hypothetical protein GIB67_003279 [Kingdonia uniflora]|uniref:Protein FAR1-RELATED SEQUENCE n=1 Tax=Kingdonia uniflora TaxID=39325 RepID=A0A7J7LXJ3_9MAGN|nr:hypothetical protein GIB67_003279 [Kingdonia uniflora]
MCKSVIERGVNVEGCAKAILNEVSRGDWYITQPAWSMALFWWKVFVPDAIEWTSRLFLLIKVGDSQTSTLFKVRKKWALVYGRDVFCADMNTTQPSERVNKFLKKFVKIKYSFTEFMNRFEMALETRRQTEVEEDFKLNQTSPTHLMYTIEERDVDGSIFRYEIPSKYILARWTKDVKADIIRDEAGKIILVNCNASFSLRYNKLCAQAIKISTKGAINEVVHTVAMRVLKNGLEKVEFAMGLPHKDSVENPKSTKANASQSDEVKVEEILTVAQGCERGCL